MVDITKKCSNTFVTFRFVLILISGQLIFVVMFDLKSCFKQINKNANLHIEKIYEALFMNRKEMKPELDICKAESFEIL